MTISPNIAAAGIAYGMVDMLSRATRLAAEARDRRVFNAWDRELAKARGNAEGMSQVAAAAIAHLADAEDEIAERDAEIDRLRKVLGQRNAALRAIRQ